MEIKRNIHLNRIIARKGNGMIKVITGMRRCGKSYLLFTLFHNYLLEQGVDEQHIIKVDMEDRRNAALRNPDALLNYIDSRMTDSQQYYILLDEVQLVAEFEDVLIVFLGLMICTIVVGYCKCRHGIVTRVDRYFLQDTKVVTQCLLVVTFHVNVVLSQEKIVTTIIQN